MRPIFGEPSYGLLLRLAARHGEPATAKFANRIGLPFRELLTGRHAEAIATLAGLVPRDLARFSPRVDAAARNVYVAGQEVSLGDWSTTSRRFCLACQASDAAFAAHAGLERSSLTAHRLFLDIRSIERCPLHRSPLLSCCTNCASTLDWRCSTLWKCPKGCTLHDETEGQELLSEFDVYLGARLGFGSICDESILRDFRFRTVVQLCERLGQLETVGWSPHLERQGRLADAKSRRFGFLMTRLWPTALNKALDAILASSAKEVSNRGMIARYGWVYSDWLAEEQDKDLLALIAPVVRAHAVRNGVISADEPILGNVTRATKTLTQAAQENALCVASARNLLLAANLIPSGSRRGVKFTLSSQHISSVLAASRRIGCSRQQAADRLAIGRSRIKAFLENGLIARKGRMIDDDSVEALLVALKKIVEPGPAPLKSVRMVAACRNRGVSLSEACRRVLDGELLAWFSGTECDIGHLFIVPADLVVPLKRELTLIEAGKLSRLHPQCVGELVRAKIIPRSSSGGIEPAALNAFLSNYISAAALADEMTVSPRAICKALEHRGIAPAFAPPAFRQVIFPRLIEPPSGLCV